MHVIATAGHVDHGKSTLIRALTGMEPDRWAEEQRRGMTIDLGYAWTTLASGTEIAFVDVPGHERFITNMLAGVGSVPAVLFVVAADAGWSAQSAQHLEALNALDVRHGVLAVTRADLGDAGVAIEEARGYLAGTSLAAIPAVAVSPVTGLGLDDLRCALEEVTTELPTHVPGPARLWIDRVFSVRGAGTVVTGTLQSGTIAVEDELEVRPSGRIVRVRGIESLKRARTDISAVARVALSLRNVKVTELRRGDALTTPGGWGDSHVIDVRLSAELPPRSRLTIHVGSASTTARVRALDESLARLTLSRPLSVHIGERLVARDPGSQLVGGATVLDPRPAPLMRRGAARARAAELATHTGFADWSDEVGRRGAVRRGELTMLGYPGGNAPDAVREVAGWFVAERQWTTWLDGLVAVADMWSRHRPLNPGVPAREMARALDVPDAALIARLVAESPELIIDQGGVHRPETAPQLSAAASSAVEALEMRLREKPFAAMESAELAAAGLSDQLLAVASRGGRLLRVAPGIYLLPDAADVAVERLRWLPGEFTVSEARQSLDTTRRVTMPLLELLDRTHRTFRVDDQRRSLRRPRDATA